MGGEPTFVSIDDMEGAEWNTAAMGPDKRRLSGELIKRLRNRFAPGGILHFGQGKWYPGESLPRWALSCYWRKDGIPIWNDPALIADDDRNLGHTDATAQRFITELALRLGGKSMPDHALPAYEDVWYYLWKERRLPVNVDPFKSNLKNEEDRKRLAKVFEQGLDKIVGYVLPLLMRGDRPRRHTGRRGNRASGSSGRTHVSDPRRFAHGIPPAAGLPPWVAPEDYPVMHERDPLELLPASRDPRSRQLRSHAHLKPCSPSGYREQDDGSSAAGRQRWREQSPPSARNSLGDVASPPAVPSRIRPVDRSHRLLRRTAQRQSSTSSCRRCATPKTTSTSSPASKKPPPT